MAIPVSLDYLELEITRRCAASCEHCMCDKAQNIDMSREIIDNN